MATYLVTANARKNFKLIMNTAVNRVVRDGGHVSGVEVQAYGKGGYCGTINVTPGTGRVVLAAGAFGSPKILMRSGIGPRDQLRVVKGAEGAKMIDVSQWIELPVGHNLDDHVNTDIVITHPNVSFYDFYGAYDKPITADKNHYLSQRTGILAQSAPNLAVVAWEEVKGADGITRQMQYTARVEGGHDIESKKAMTISQYLGRGATSRGRTTITAGLNMVVSTVPYLHDKNDVAAVATSIDNLIASLKKDPLIKVVYGPTNQSTADWLASYPLTTGARSANHWVGSCKMGLDSGLINNGTAVVDTNTKVYGTDNLFVVDASIFPGMVSNNPSALIVAVAEHASEKLLALPNTNSSVVVNATSISANSTAPYGTGLPSGTGLSLATGKPSGTAPFGAGINAVSASSKCTKDITLTRSRSATASATLAPFPTSNGTLADATGASAPLASATSAASPIVSPAMSSASAPSSAATGAADGSSQVSKWQQCGGNGYTGGTTCESGLICKAWNPY